MDWLGLAAAPPGRDFWIPAVKNDAHRLSWSIRT